MAPYSCAGERERSTNKLVEVHQLSERWGDKNKQLSKYQPVERIQELSKEGRPRNSHNISLRK